MKRTGSAALLVTGIGVIVAALFSVSLVLVITLRTIQPGLSFIDSIGAASSIELALMGWAFLMYSAHQENKRR